MTEMEEDIYERAFIHWKEKRKMKIENVDRGASGITPEHS